MAKTIGTVVQIMGPVLDIRFEEGQLPQLLNAIHVPNGENTVVAEVAQHIGDNVVRCIAMSSTDGMQRGVEAIDTGAPIAGPVGEDCLGRVFNLLGQPIDNKGPLEQGTPYCITGSHINPLSRPPIREQMEFGVKAIDGMLTIGKGQRIGIFAGSGVGKSVLLGMMTRGSVADVVVVGLIGERGREVKEFIEDILGPEGRARSVVVAAPADASPLMRLKCGFTALKSH